MGSGNFFIEDAATVYIDDDQIYSENEDGELNYDDSFVVDDLKDLIRSVLPKSYSPEDESFDRDSGNVIARNGHYDIVLTSWQGYYAVSVAVIEQPYWVSGSMEKIAKSHLEERAKTIFDKLSDCYELGIRTSAWTSGQYQKAA